MALRPFLREYLSSSPEPSLQPEESTPNGPFHNHFITNLPNYPDEILALICNELEEKDLINLALAWRRIGGTDGTINKFNTVKNWKLLSSIRRGPFPGKCVGIEIFTIADSQGKTTLASDCELLTLEEYRNKQLQLEHDHSRPGIWFRDWLPMPVSRDHYNVFKHEVNYLLQDIGRGVRYWHDESYMVIFTFLNDVVVKLLSEAAMPVMPADVTRNLRSLELDIEWRDTVGPLCEKAMGSFFHLCHFLLCLATSDDSVLDAANNMLRNFANGQTSKTECPDLNHLLLAALIADKDPTEDLIWALVRETITRNVAGMLDVRRGAGMVDLIYLEPDQVCEYRIKNTFEASKESYRLLMLFNVFRRKAHRGYDTDRKSLEQARGDLFIRGGAPPLAAATSLQLDVRRILAVKDFGRDFFSIMCLEEPTRADLTQFLRDCVQDSMDKKYIRKALTQEKAKLWGEGTKCRVGSFHPYAPRTRRGGRGRGRGDGRQNIVR